MKRVRIADVAAKAGVSNTTVSLVLSNKAAQYRISEALAERVRLVAAELDYTPNMVARGLRAQSTNTVGIVALGKQDPYAYMFIEAIEEEAQRQGLSTFIGYSGREPELLGRRIGQLLDWRVSGIIFEWVPGFEATAAFRQFTASGSWAAVAIRGHVPETAPLVNVGFDHIEILNQTLDRALVIGHRRFLLVDTAFDNEDRQERHEYLFARLRDDAATSVATLSVEQEEEAACAAVLPALRQPADRRPTFLIAQSQSRADGCLLAAAQCSLAVPDELSIVCVTGYQQKKSQRVIFDQFRYDHHALGARAFRTLEELRRGTYTGPRRSFEATGAWQPGATVGPVPVYSGASS
jgi:DNA-binding LacI/PurR family transcriptional regulator